MVIIQIFAISAMILTVGFHLGVILFPQLQNTRIIATFLGYVLINLIYYGFLRLFTSYNQLASLFTFFSIFIIFLMNLLLKSSRKIEISLNETRVTIIKKMQPLIIALALIIFQSLIKMQTLESAVSNVLTIWHSANNDIFDGLCGAKNILNINVINPNLHYPTSSLSLIKFSPNWVCNGDSNTFLNSLGAFQYSNLAFLAQTTHTIPSMFHYYILSSIYAVFFLASTFQFFKNGLKLTKKISTLLSLIAVFSHFYFSTFINGHIGTQMIASAAALLLNLIIKTENKSELIKNLTIICIIFVFIFLTYPYLLPFLFLILIITRVNFKRIPRKYLKIGFVLLPIAFFLLFSITYAYRLKAENSFRAWGSITTWILPYQYLGVFPGNIFNSGFLGGVQDAMIATNTPESLLAFIGFLALISSLVYLSLNLLRNRDYRHLRLLSSIVIVPFLTYIFTRDSYFVYKTLYIFQFVAIGYFGYVMSGRKRSNLKKVVPKQITLILCAFLVFMNSFWNYKSVASIFNFSANHGALAKNLIAINENVLGQTITLNPDSAESLSAAYILSYVRNNEIFNSKARVLELRIIENLNQSGIEIASIPDDFLLIDNKYVSPMEMNGSEKFRWVSSYTNDTNIVAQRLNSSGKRTPTFFCANLAKFGKVYSLSFSITDENHKVLLKETMYKDKRCYVFNLEPKTSLIILNFKQIGSRPSVFDGRKLLFQLYDGVKDLNTFF